MTEGEAFLLRHGRLKPVKCTVCYIIYLLLGKVLHPIREARKACQIPLSFPSVKALAMFPHCSTDLIYFANSFPSTFGWHNMERSFHLHICCQWFPKAKSRQLKSVLKLGRTQSFLLNWRRHWDVGKDDRFLIRVNILGGGVMEWNGVEPCRLERKAAN